MFNYVCSLKVSEAQSIGPDTWTVVRFPYTSENSDDYGMHEPPTATTNWKTDVRSGLITPVAPGWGLMAAMVQFVDGEDATEFRTQFIRDPAGIADTTATQHVRDTAGGDYYVTAWPLYFRPTEPVALRVYHNASTALSLTTAEFKVLI